MSIYNVFDPTLRGGAVKEGDPPFRLNERDELKVATMSVTSGPGIVRVNYAPYKSAIVIGVKSEASSNFAPATVRFNLPDACVGIRLKTPGYTGSEQIPPGVTINLYDSSEAIVKTYATPYLSEIDYEGRAIKYMEIEASAEWFHIELLKYYT